MSRWGHYSGQDSGKQAGDFFYDFPSLAPTPPRRRSAPTQKRVLAGRYTEAELVQFRKTHPDVEAWLRKTYAEEDRAIAWHAGGEEFFNVTDAWVSTTSDVSEQGRENLRSLLRQMRRYKPGQYAAGVCIKMNLVRQLGEITYK